MNQEAKTREVPNAERTRAAEQVRTLSVFALVRTAFSSERALMAWMRTSVSLYSFGFTISKFVDYLERQGEGSQCSEGPRRLGLALICMGILVLVLAAVEHVRRIVKMKQLGLPPISRFPLPVAAAAALFIIGTAALIGIAGNWSP
jgi:putative membrane protein